MLRANGSLEKPKTDLLYAQYPRENEYESLAKHSGHSNAYTALTSTNIYYELSETSTSKIPSSSATRDAAQQPNVPLASDKGPSMAPSIGSRNSSASHSSSPIPSTVSFVP